MERRDANPCLQRGHWLRHAAPAMLLVAGTLMAGRIVQLATAPTEAPQRTLTAGTNPPSPRPVTSDRTSPYQGGESRRQAELEQLYALCPMAAVVDLEKVAAHDEVVDRLVPSYMPMAERVPNAPIEPAVPRLRYPIKLRSSAAADSSPRIAAIEPSPGPSLQGRGADGGGPLPDPRSNLDPSPTTAADAGEWLVDPREWYGEGLEVGGQGAGSEASETETSPAGDGESRPENKSDPRSLASPATPAEVSRPSEVTPPSESVPVEPVPPTSEVAPSIQHPASSIRETPGADASGSPIGDPATSIQQPASNIEQPVLGVEQLPPGTASAGPPSAVLFRAPAEKPRVDPHLELLARNAYPSARECAECHEDIYHEWSASAHAYAAVSPMFHKFEQKLNDLSQGTVGYFCMRCHAPVATALCASRAEPLWNLPESAREGVTCIVCHRVQYVYGKSNGERRIEPGSVFAPVFGGIGGDGVAETIHRRDEFKVRTAPPQPSPERGGSVEGDEWGGSAEGPLSTGSSPSPQPSPEGRGSQPGMNMHVAGIYFDPLTRSEFCTPCHQVAVHPGIKLEVVWEQYRASPACKKGIECQDCHMGKVPGLPNGYNIGPVAKMAGKTVNDVRKRSNHIFYGPNYSIAHPGIFPFHLKANRWSMEEWLAFDWRAGWGTEQFENAVEGGQVQVAFPPVWAETDDRRDAREIIEENLAKLNRKRELRLEVMENGSHVEGPFFDSAQRRGQELRFHYVITNTNEGHNLLTASLGAQPQYWANIVLIGPDGRRLWETGYLDSYGDLANIHSIDVRHKRLAYDAQLFNLQTIFLITGAKGTDREFFVPVNLDIDQLPFIRPGVQPISVINHPPFIRMESQSLAPLGSRRASYSVPAHLMQQPGTYRLAFRMRSRAEPIYFMRFCEATPEMERSMNEWMIDVHPKTVEFEVR